MTKEELKQYIDENIYENEDGDITGEGLNAVLKAIVDDGGTEVEANPTGEATDTLGKLKIGEGIYEIPQTNLPEGLLYGGEVYPNTVITPDIHCYYIAKGSGNYVSFGNAGVNPSEKICYLYYDESNRQWDSSEFDTYKYSYAKSKFDQVTVLGESTIQVDSAQNFTNAERLQALANVSNQDAEYDSSEPPVFTGKMGYIVLQPEKEGVATTSFATQIANKPNTIFEIRDVFDLDDAEGENPVVMPVGSILQFNGGAVKNGAIRGFETQVIVSNRDAVAFDGIKFSGTWANSDLTAKNFGCVSDLDYEEGTLTLKGLNLNIEIAKGTDNKDAIEHIKEFLYGSKNIKLEFNGFFYVSESKKLQVYSAQNIEIYGGTIVAGISIYGSRDINIHNIKFVGYHKPHDIPKVCYTPSNVDTDVWYPGGENEPTWADMGFAGSCVTTAHSTFILGYDKYNENVNVMDCYFEMRCGGIVFGDYASNQSVADTLSYADRNCHAYNCIGTRIYQAQPFGTHGISCTAENFILDYVGQAIDISSYSRYCTVRNFKATNCLFGPKFTTLDNTGTYGNTMDNIDIEVVPNKYVDLSAQLVNCSGENNKPVNRLLNSTLKMYSQDLLESRYNTVGCSFSTEIFVSNTKFYIENVYAAFGVSNAQTVTLENVDVDLYSNDSAAEAAKRGTMYLVFNGANCNVNLKGCKINVYGDTVNTANTFAISTVAINAVDSVLSGFARFNQINNYDNKFVNCTISCGVFLRCQNDDIYYKVTAENCKITCSDEVVSNNHTPNVGSYVRLKNSTISGKKIDFALSYNTLTYNTLYSTENVEITIENCFIKLSGPEPISLGVLGINPNTVIKDNVFVFTYNGQTIIGYSTPYNPGLIKLFADASMNNQYLGTINTSEVFGDTNHRPYALSRRNSIGAKYFDTTLGKEIMWNGTKWTNVDGTDLSNDLQVNPRYIMFESTADSTGKNANVIYTGGGTLSVSSSEAWCTASIAGNTVNVQVSANTGTTRRRAIVTVTDGTISSTIFVEQKKTE